MKGLRVEDIVDSSGNGAKAGFIIYDIIVKVGTCEVASVDSLISIMQEKEGQSCDVEIIRDEKVLTVTVTAGSLGLSLVPVAIGELYYNAKMRTASDDDRLRLHQQQESISLTTAPSIEGFKIVKSISIVGAECAFGMNIFKDIFISVRDVTGGRSNALQNTLRDARNECLSDLKREAFLAGANAIIGVNLDYSEFSGGSKSMVFVAATGTAVIVEPE